MVPVGFAYHPNGYSYLPCKAVVGAGGTVQHQFHQNPIAVAAVLLALFLGVRGFSFLLVPCPLLGSYLHGGWWGGVKWGGSCELPGLFQGEAAWTSDEDDEDDDDACFREGGRLGAVMTMMKVMLVPRGGRDEDEDACFRE